MRKNSCLKSPKTEEQEVPNNYDDKGFETLDDLEGFLGINSDFNVDEDDDQVPHHKHEENDFWDFFNLGWEAEESPSNNDQIGREGQKESCSKVSSGSTNSIRNEEFSGHFGFSNEVIDETKASLNLSLNYEEVLEAWSNRGSLWTDHHRHQHPSFSISNSNYMGEVPNLEDERTRRETSVLRYKEKRQSRLFSKKIRYQVRKLNADKRPRLKGRFVKRTPDSNKMSKAAVG